MSSESTYTADTPATLTEHESSKVTSTSTDQPLLNQPISGQFIKLAFPIIIALLINGLYSFIDAVFITRGVGIEAMAAVSAVFPLTMLITSISAMLGSGMASIISRRLGKGDKEAASKVFSSSILFTTIIGLLSTLLLFFLKDDVYQLLSLPIHLIPYADQYFLPILFFSISSFLVGCLNENFRAAGNAQDMMKVLVLFSLLNIIFDALFIFGFGWGVAGAAWATVLASLLSLLLALRIQTKTSNTVKFQRKYFRLYWPTHKEVVALGIPIFLSHAGFAFAIALTIYAVTRYSGDDASLLISAHGLMLRSFMLLFLPLLGMMIALQTLAGFNYGAGQLDRVKKSLLVAIAYASIWCVLVTFILVVKPQWLLQLFTEDKALIKTASDIGKISFLGFIFGGCAMMCSGVFQAMGKALPAMLLDSIRTYLLLFPAIIFLPKYLGVVGIWWAFPLADVIGVFITGSFTLWYFQRRFSQSKH